MLVFSLNEYSHVEFFLKQTHTNPIKEDDVLHFNSIDNHDKKLISATDLFQKINKSHSGK